MERFTKKIIEIYKNKNTNSKWMTKERYDTIIADISSLKNVPPTAPKEYWLLKKYDLLIVGGVKELITKPVSIFKATTAITPQ